MLNFICAIPDSIGWAIVGALIICNAVMFFKLGKMFIEIWKIYKEDEEVRAD